MAKKYNISENSTLLRFQNMWVAFDGKGNVIVSAKTYLGFHRSIPEDLRGKVETTFINSSKAFLAPLYGSF